MQENKSFSSDDVDRIIEMAWEDRTPFDAIEVQFGIREQQVIALMRQEMKPSSFRMWRKRVQGRATKHLKLAGSQDHRFKSSLQKQISNNNISKRA
ncbi:MAG: TIGR03643 family protein [Dyadobacter sp.]|uniref:TIGR03643 family protein n=1 Tax=Dyadobacter sp. TaxID=1914288 RepID=UPI0032656DBD